MEVCFICGSPGFCEDLQVRERERTTDGAREPCFPFLTAHEVPHGSAGISSKGHVRACSICRAFLLQQWKRFEAEDAPLVRRLYFLKRNDLGPFTGADVNAPADITAHLFGYHVSGAGDVPAAPVRVGASPTSSTSSTPVTSTVHVSAGGKTPQAPAVRSPTPPPPAPTALPSEHHIRCFLCHAAILKWDGKTAYASQVLESKEFYPFFEKVAASEAAIPLLNGATKICGDCESSLSGQWHNYELARTPQSHRVYRIAAGPAGGPMRFFSNSASPDSNHTSPSKSAAAAPPRDSPCQGPIIAQCHVCLCNLRDPRRLKTVRARCDNDAPCFPFLTSLRQGSSVLGNAFPVCEVCHLNLTWQWNEYQRGGWPTDSRTYYYQELVCAGCRRLYADRELVTIGKDCLLCKNCVDEKNSPVSANQSPTKPTTKMTENQKEIPKPEKCTNNGLGSQTASAHQLPSAAAGSSAKPPPLAIYPGSGPRSTATVPPMPHPHNHTTPSTPTAGAPGAAGAPGGSSPGGGSSGFAEALRQLAKHVGTDDRRSAVPASATTGAGAAAANSSSRNSSEPERVSASAESTSSDPRHHPPVVTIAPSQRSSASVAAEVYSSSAAAAATADRGFQPYLRGPGAAAGSGMPPPQSPVMSSAQHQAWNEQLMMAQLYSGMMTHPYASPGGQSPHGIPGYPGASPEHASMWYQRLMQAASGGVGAGGQAPWHRAAAAAAAQQQAAAAAQMEMMQHYMLSMQQQQHQQAAAAAMMQGLMQQGRDPASAMAAAAALYGFNMPAGLSPSASSTASRDPPAPSNGKEEVRRRDSGPPHLSPATSTARAPSTDTTSGGKRRGEEGVLDLSRSQKPSNGSKSKFYRPFEDSPPRKTALPESVPTPTKRSKVDLSSPRRTLRVSADQEDLQRCRKPSDTEPANLGLPALSPETIKELQKVARKRRLSFDVHMNLKRRKMKSEPVSPEVVSNSATTESQLAEVELEVDTVTEDNEFLTDPPNALSDSLCKGKDYLEKKRFLRAMALQPLTRQAKKDHDGRRKNVALFVERLRLRALLRSLSPNNELAVTVAKEGSATEEISKCENGTGTPVKREKSGFDARSFHASVLKMSNSSGDEEEVVATVKTEPDADALSATATDTPQSETT